MSIEENVCRNLRQWVNHSKESTGRYEDDLINFDKMWEMFKDVITKCEQGCCEEEKDIVSMVKYVGPLYRAHKKYKINDSKFGVKETIHYVSWTKNSNLSDIYWIYEGMQYLKITAQATPDCYGIDLVGLNNYIQKYWFPNFSLGSPAIIKEQEVVFPIQFNLIEKIEIAIL
jgi:hypothetical protein